MVKAIEVTKRYDPTEVKKLSELFLYLNHVEGLMDKYKYGVSAKWLWKLLTPLTKNGKPQKFDDRRTSVSNIARLKEKEDFVRQETITKVESQISDLSEISETSKTSGRWGKRIFYGTKEIDFILTLRAGEYFATLTKGDAGELYRRFIFDIKDEFIRLVFRWGKSLATRIEFTTAIGKLSFVNLLDAKELGRLFAKFTNLVYLNLQDVEIIASSGSSLSSNPKHRAAAVSPTYGIYSNRALIFLF